VLRHELLSFHDSSYELATKTAIDSYEFIPYAISMPNLIRRVTMMKVSNGNHKVGRDTLILNITSARDCVSAKLGLCQLCDSSKCYALKAERMYPSVLPYRQAQTEQWDSLSAQQLAAGLLAKARAKRSNPIKYVRLQESGDFRTQADVDKAEAMARLLNAEGITTYTYTARRDLDFSQCVALVVNGSGFMASNEFKAVASYSPKAIKCKGACLNCQLCKVSRNLTIEVEMH